MHCLCYPGLALALLQLAAVPVAADEPPSDDRFAEAPMPAEQAAASMQLPEGFQATVFAAEPDVQQPIGFCIDDRGRLWVAEAYSYPRHTTEGNDRIVILEDTDGDGRFDKRKVFYDRLNYVTGIEVGFGGVWVMSPPYFYFIPDADGDDRPDGPPEVLLDGFGTHANSHNLANALAWGPDGWLYGTHGRTNWSQVGKPGTPDEERQVFDGGVYRYHPIRHQWEPFADGTTNPWGIDWNDYGHGFVCNCVNPHLFQVIQGAHYEPWRNRDSSRYAYQRIATIADHLHFVGTANVRDGLGSDDEDHAGGGHAHCGTMIYLGDNWPDRYRNQVFMHNIHGRRINHDDLRRRGSGYVASHAPDLMRHPDPWFMGVSLRYGPDGAVYSSDWSDRGECHTVRNTHRQSGRIYKISFGRPPHRPVDIAALSDAELVELQLHRNDWFVRHGRRVLQQRWAAGEEMTKIHAALRDLFHDHPEVPRQLRALWTLHATAGADVALLSQALAHRSEHIRAWAIQLLFERPERVEAGLFRRVLELARADPSPLVRLYLASAAQRLEAARRWPLVESLVAHGEDAEDVNLPLMYWYAAVPLYDDDPLRLVELAARSEIPVIQRHIARRVGDGAVDAQIEQVVQLIAATDDAGLADELVMGLLRGTEGRRTVKMPPSWPRAYRKIRQRQSAGGPATRLALRFDDAEALEVLRRLAESPDHDSQRRREAVRTLVSRQVPELDDWLLQRLDDPQLCAVALRGLAQYDHPRTAEEILDRYDRLDDASRRDAVQTLASRVAWASRLLDAVAAGRVPGNDLTAFTARQLKNLGDEVLAERVSQLWGNVRPTPEDKAAAIAKLKKRATPEKLQRADKSAGRALFEAKCASCHRLFGHGASIGPELTGAQRSNLDYLLENLIDPSATVSKDYQMQLILTDSGRVITGLLVARGERALTIQTTNERLTVPLDEIQRHEVSSVSVMPEGLLETLSQRQVIELLAYLGSPRQVPLPPGVSARQFDDSAAGD